MLAMRIRIVFCVLLAAIYGVRAHPAFAAEGDGMKWFSLDGKSVAAGNTPDAQGLLRKFDAPVLGVSRTAATESRGTVMLCPGGAYSILDLLNEGTRTAEKLNSFGYDVVMLEYHVGQGVRSRDLALEDGLAAWRLLRDKPDALGLKAGRLVLMGYSAGGHLATRMVQGLPEKEQPDDLILVYPAYLEEMAAGAQTVAVLPPQKMKSRLVALMAADDRANWVKGARDYVAAWQKGGGYGIMFEFKTGGHGFGMKPALAGDLAEWPKILNYFLENGPKPGVGPFNTVLPWFLPNVEGRQAAFKKEKAADEGAVVFLGDSITSKWQLGEAFAGMKVANRGISGDTTRGMFCRLQENVLDLHPKAIVLLGGINDFTQQPKGTAETISANVRSILEGVRAANPQVPVLVCEILPSRNATAETLRATNAAVDKVMEEFPNAHRVKTYTPFLNADGTQNASLFLDGTHPNPAGYAVWQNVLKPELAKYVRP